METFIEKATEQMKELIEMNNDRAKGYKFVAEETRDEDLKALFTEYSRQSMQFSNEIVNRLPANEHGPDSKTDGDFFELVNKDRKGILASFEYKDDEVLKTYDEVLEHPHGLEIGTFNLIQLQQLQLQHAVAKIKSMRSES